jgi:hypothetical protein
VIFIVGAAIVLAAHGWYDRVASPQEAADVAVASLNGSDADAARARAAGEYRSAADDMVVYGLVTLAAACFGPVLIRALAAKSRVHNLLH